MKIKEEQVKEMVLDYLTETSKHLFTIKSEHNESVKDNFFKILPAVINDVLYVIRVSSDDGKTNVTISSTEHVKTKNIFGSSFKDSIFPKYRKHSSIKKIKIFDDKFSEIKNIIESESNEGIEIIKNKIQKS